MTYRKGCTAILFAALLANRGAGQTRIDLRTQTRNADFSAQPTTPSATGTVLPATCTVGQTYFKTDAAAGKNWYGCTAPDTWTPQAGAEPAPNYAVPLSAQTVVTVPGSMHKFGTANLVAECYDNSTPPQSVEPDSVLVDGSSYDVTINFSTPQTGYCVLNGAGGSGGLAASGMAAPWSDLSVALTNPTMLSIGSSCSASAPCNVRFGSTVYSFTGGATATVTSGTGTAYIYVTAGGVLTVGYLGGVSCSPGCAVAAGVTAFAPDVVPLFTWTATNGVWDADGGRDWRAFLSTKPLTAGLGTVASDAGGQTVIGIDTATVPSFLTGTATLDFSAMASGTCVERTFSLTGAAIGDGVAAGWPGGLPNGFLGLMRVSAANTVAVRLCNFSGSSQAVSDAFRATVVRSF